jgi:hypothetical protein
MTILQKAFTKGVAGGLEPAAKVTRISRKSRDADPDATVPPSNATPDTINNSVEDGSSGGYPCV